MTLTLGQPDDKKARTSFLLCKTFPAHSEYNEAVMRDGGDGG
jgi:hypothetical protein